MSGGFPSFAEICSGTDAGTDEAGSLAGTSVQESGTNNVKGSWAQLTPAAPFDVSWMLVVLKNNAGTYFVYDIGVGAASSEVVVLSNLIHSQQMSDRRHYLFPVSIPARTRIAVRCATLQAPQSASYAYVILFDSSLAGAAEGAAGAEFFGFDSGNAWGTQVNCLANKVKGSWTPIIASTSRDYIGLLLNFDARLADFWGTGLNIDIGIGSAGSEIPILSDLIFMFGQYDVAPHCYAPFFIAIPVGTRISVRGCTSSVSDKTVGATICGVYQ